MLALIVIAGAVIFALWFSLLLPQNKRRLDLERQVEHMTRQLEQNGYLRGEELLVKRRTMEQARARELARRWQQIPGRLGTLADLEKTAAAPIGHIDFKVALFQVRERLRQKSKTVGIGLPHDLGIDESVTGGRDARRLMFQLRAVEKLVDLSLDLKIERIRRIEPLDLIEHIVGHKEELFMEEYPVRIVFNGGMENVYDLLHAVLTPDHTFFVRGLRILRDEGNPRETVSVDAVLCGLVFLKDPRQLAPPVVESVVPLSPRGF